MSLTNHPNLLVPDCCTHQVLNQVRAPQSQTSAEINGPPFGLGLVPKNKSSRVRFLTLYTCTLPCKWWCPFILVEQHVSNGCRMYRSFKEPCQLSIPFITKSRHWPGPSDAPNPGEAPKNVGTCTTSCKVSPQNGDNPPEFVQKQKTLQLEWENEPFLRLPPFCVHFLRYVCNV